MPKNIPSRLYALLLLGLAALDGWYGCSLNGALLGRIWWGTVLLEGALLLAVAAICLAFQAKLRPAGLACIALLGVLIFGGAQHFARAARRHAMATGELPAAGGEGLTADEIRERFARCFAPGLSEFHELEVGIVPAARGQSRPRWLLTQAYAPMTGIPLGFRIASAYLTLKTSRTANGPRQFSGDIAALGLDPRPFVEAAARDDATLQADVPDSDSAERASALAIPEHSISVLTYPAHAVPELDAHALRHPGSIVIDPTELRSMSYGWEWVWLSRKHPRIGLHEREGAGDYEGQQEGVGDFHGLHNTIEKSEVVYDFKVEQAGYYGLHALILPEATKCSNYPQAAIDDGSYADLGHNDCVPYAWYRADWRGGVCLLGAGWHQMHLHFMQDGLTLAQFWLTPMGESTSAAETTAPPERPPLNLLLTRRSMAIVNDETADFGAWVQNFGKLSGEAVLDAELDPGRGRPHVIVHREIQLDPNVAIQEIPISLVLPANLPAREMRVTVTLTKPGEDLKVERESTVVKPFRAQLLGPIERPHDKDLSITDAEYVSPQNGAGPKDLAWRPFPANAVTYYGLYDLNRAFGGSAFEGVFFSRAYVAVRLDVPAAGEYLLKLMGDDVVTVWIDGAQIYSSERKGPSIRYPGTKLHKLTAGEHLMVMHCDQTTGWWQCGVHLRTASDDVCDIEGVEQ